MVTIETLALKQQSLVPTRSNEIRGSSTSDVITFDQNWHHLYSTSAGGKDLSNDAQIRVIGRMEHQISQKSCEKLRAKFPATTPGCSMLKFACLDDAFLEVFNCKQAQQKVNHCSKHKRKGERKAEKIPKIKKPKDVGHFLSKF